MKIATLIQKLFGLRLVLVLAIALAFGACKNNDPQPEESFSQEIKNNIPQATIDMVRQMGVKVNEGTKPPVLEGTYWLSPLVMTKTEVPNDSYKVGHQFNDYKIRLYNQDSKKLTISLDSKGYNLSGVLRSTAIGLDGAYISGSGNFFTVFVVTEGANTYNTSKYRVLEVYSGEITSTGIKNTQTAILMMDNYGNINNDLIPNNTGRAFEDSDHFSESGKTFRIAASTKTDEHNEDIGTSREQMLQIEK